MNKAEYLGGALHGWLDLDGLGNVRTLPVTSSRSVQLTDLEAHRMCPAGGRGDWYLQPEGKGLTPAHPSLGPPESLRLSVPVSSSVKTRCPAHP